MEINLGRLGTLGKTVTFDLCYLSAICRHNKLLFIIIVLFYYQSVLSLAFFRHSLSVLFHFSHPVMKYEFKGVILGWSKVFAKRRMYRLNTVDAVARSDTALLFSSAVPVSVPESYSSLFCFF